VSVGDWDGCADGCADGWEDGEADGCTVGWLVGDSVGECVGLNVGDCDGMSVGGNEGCPDNVGSCDSDGLSDGICDTVGSMLGCSEGLSDGIADTDGAIEIVGAMVVGESLSVIVGATVAFAIGLSVAGDSVGTMDRRAPESGKAVSTEGCDETASLIAVGGCVGNGDSVVVELSMSSSSNTDRNRSGLLNAVAPAAAQKTNDDGLFHAEM